MRKSLVLTSVVVGLAIGASTLSRLSSLSPSATDFLSPVAASDPGLTSALLPQATTPHATQPSPQKLLLLNEVAAHLTQPSSPEQENEIRAKARNLTTAETNELCDLVLNDRSASNDKIAAVYLLAEAEAYPALAKIALTPLRSEGRAAPHSLAEMKLHEQRSLRITAMDALDEASFEHPENRLAFARLLSGQSDPSLQRLALIALRGYEQNRPGKLHRYIVSATDLR